jgi:hypothetical protein
VDILLAPRGPTHLAPRLVFVDARGGGVLEDADETRASVFIQTCDDMSRWNGWVAAEELTESHPRYREITTLLDREVVERRGTPELAEHGGLTVVSTHARSRHSADAMLQGQLDNILLVHDGSRVVFRDTIASGLSATSSDAFFLRNDILYYVRDARTLVAVSLDVDG